jgi:diguanylate cyclase (GGDEF)-like protein
MERPSIAPKRRIGTTPALILSLLWSGAVGVLDYITGWQVSFSIFYIAPILLATWYGSANAGVLLSIVSTVLWLTSDLLTAVDYDHPAIPYWNAVVRFAFFFLLSFILGKLKERFAIEKEMARTDGLTGAYNSRAFYELADTELRRARRYGRPFTMAYIDLDNFKFVNDSMGHAMGDKVLCVVADILRENIRETDVAARLGGDEFSALFIETDGARSSVIVEKLLARLNRGMADNRWPVTFSVGAITYNHALPHSVQEMITAADRLMYQAKERGKNQVVIAVFAETTNDGDIPGRSGFPGDRERHLS